MAHGLISHFMMCSAALIGGRHGGAGAVAIGLQLLDFVLYRDGVANLHGLDKAHAVIADGHGCQIVPGFDDPGGDHGRGGGH